MSQINFEVRRIRMSVTQGEAHVYANGKFVINFGDTIEIIKKGETYYGELIGGWASTVPDSSFIKGLFRNWEYDHYPLKTNLNKILLESNEPSVLPA